MVETARRRFSRRRALRDLAGAVAGPAAAGLIAPRVRAQAKAPKQAVRYQDEPQGNQRCDGCRYFIAAERACERVEGDIAPAGWCTLWAPTR